MQTAFTVSIEAKEYLQVYQLLIEQRQLRSQLILIEKRYCVSGHVFLWFQEMEEFWKEQAILKLQ